MGYCMSKDEASFMIRHENKAKALEKVKDWAKKQGRLAWIDDSDFEEETLEKVLENIRWKVELDKFYNIVDIDFTGEKLGDETKIFGSFAEFVEPGSYIQMTGEDGDKWRWVFDGKECKWLDPKISWD